MLVLVVLVVLCRQTPNTGTGDYAYDLVNMGIVFFIKTFV